MLVANFLSIIHSILITFDVNSALPSVVDEEGPLTQMSSFDAGETKQRGHLKGPMKQLQCHKKDPLENTVFSTILASGGPFSGQNGSRNRSPEGSGGVPGASGRAL